MPKKLDKIPETLQYLVPEKAEQVVVIGKDAYTVVPLTVGEFESLITIVTGVLLTVTKEILASTEAIRNGIASEANQTSVYMDAIRKGLSDIVATGDIVKIIAIALDLDEEVIRKEASLKQLHHFASVFWKQNMDLSDAPEETEKNFNRLLGTMGFGHNESKVYQWAETTLMLLQDSTSGSPTKRIDTVLEIAFELGLLKKRPTRQDDGA